MSARCLTYVAATALVFGFWVSGCVTPVRGTSPTITNEREITDTPFDRVMDKPAVHRFLAACDFLARDLAASDLVQYAVDPLVVEIRPIEDRTGQSLDLTIYPQVMREKLMNMGHGKIVFRDEDGRQDIIDERIDQSGEPIQVTQTKVTTVTGEKKTTRPGRYDGKGGVGTQFKVDETGTTSDERRKQTEVSGRIADVQYFLKGFVYRQDERTAGVHRRGYRYYRFQFRLTNARTNMVAWSKAHEFEVEGALGD